MANFADLIATLDLDENREQKPKATGTVTGTASEKLETVMDRRIQKVKTQTPKTKKKPRAKKNRTQERTIKDLQGNLHKLEGQLAKFTGHGAQLEGLAKRVADLEQSPQQTDTPDHELLAARVDVLEAVVNALMEDRESERLFDEDLGDEDEDSPQEDEEVDEEGQEFEFGEVVEPLSARRRPRGFPVFGRRR